MHLLYHIYWVVVFILSYEALMWCWTVNRHATWLRQHPHLDKRQAVTPRQLRCASCMTASLSLGVWLLFIYITMTELMYPDNPQFWVFIQNLVIASIQLSHIHLFAVGSRYMCLPRSMWPLLSKWVSMLLVKFMKMKEPVLTSYEVRSCWRKTTSHCVNCTSKHKA